MLLREASILGISTVHSLTQKDASEETVTNRLLKNEASILHFAVHGYGREAGEKSVLRELPGYCGIELAASEESRHRSADGDSLSPRDGKVSWREIACLNLSHAWLAVLSSCSSGLGARRPGEGIVGMRWGFQQAGVPSQLLTLWDIDDSKETVEFAQRFYTSIRDPRVDPRTEVWALQRELLPRAARNSFHDAVRVYGAFTLYSVGR
jgi:CHAT domain-containing protein